MIITHKPVKILGCTISNVVFFQILFNQINNIKKISHQNNFHHLVWPSPIFLAVIVFPSCKSFLVWRKNTNLGLFWYFQLSCKFSPGRNAASIGTSGNRMELRKDNTAGKTSQSGYSIISRVVSATGGLALSCNKMTFCMKKFVFSAKASLNRVNFCE